MRSFLFLPLLAVSAASLSAQSVQTVTGETPAFRPSLGQWSVSHPPIAIACFRNGMRQKTGADFTISGTLMSSKTWAQADVLICDYAFVVPNASLNIVAVDPPLTIIKDATGHSHLSLAAQFIFTKITEVAAYVPASTTNGGVVIPASWTLTHQPFEQVDCFRNGLLAVPGTDFTMSFASIASSVWAATDVIMCSYRY